MKSKVELWAKRLKVTPRLVRVQKMTRKWGSCSTAGTITLAADLVDQPASFQDFVVTHELLHLVSQSTFPFRKMHNNKIYLPRKTSKPRCC